jgi:hypothetical protein
MGWIQTIAKSVESAFNALRAPLAFLPPILLLCEIFRRPGLSCLSLTAAIIKGLQKAGVPTGVNNDGSPNITSLLVKTISCSVIDELQNNAVVEGVLAPGQLVSFGIGANAGGPVPVTSYNLLSTSNIRGIIR